jgi:hypothetical protein
LISRADEQPWTLYPEMPPHLSKDGSRWLIERMVIRNVWMTGDPPVLFGPPRRD